MKKGNLVNLERCLKIGDRLDGHFVQGHVDTIAKTVSVKKERGSWTFAFEIPNPKSQIPNLLVDKGSICINGVSLTVVAVRHQPSNIKHPAIVFSVAIIPHTFQQTNFSNMKKGDVVNIEFDVLGKYISKIIASKQ